MAEQEVYISVNMLKQYLRDANNRAESSSVRGDSDVSASHSFDTPEELNADNLAAYYSHRPSKNYRSLNEIRSSNYSVVKTERKDKPTKSKVKTKDTRAKTYSVLSGYSDDLSSEFNQY